MNSSRHISGGSRYGRLRLPLAGGALVMLAGLALFAAAKGLPALLPGLALTAAAAAAAVVWKFGIKAPSSKRAASDSMGQWEGPDASSLAKPSSHLREEEGDLDRKIRKLHTELELSRQTAARAEQEMRAAHLATRRLQRLLERELRTPLNSLLGISELLLDSNLDARGRRLAQSLQHSLEGMRELLEQALTRLPQASTEKESDEAPVSLRSLLEETLIPFHHLAAQKGLSLRLEFSPGTPGRILGSALKLGRMVENLTRRMVALASDGEVLIRVTTHGRDPDQRLKIFVHGAMTESHWRALIQSLEEGSDEENGFSELQATAALALGCGGRLEAIPKEQNGPGLLLDLPLKVAPPAPSTGGVPRRCHRVLLVDDNTVNQMITRTMLEALGCEVILATGGEEAVQLASEGGYELIFMDCHMPEVDGFEAARRIRRIEGEETHVPIVALTADVHEGIRERCRQAGMDDYLSKPYTREDLARCLARWLSRDTLEENGETPPPASATSDSAVLDPARLDALRAMGRSRGSNLLEKAARHYIDHMPAELRRLRRAVENGLAEEVRLVAHNLKSSSDMLGANAIAAQFSVIERLGREQRLEDAPTALEKAEALLPRVLDALEEAIHHKTSPPPVRLVEPASGGGRILLVDDDAAFRMVTLTSLREAGFTVLEAASGTEALALVDAEPPELILLDALMEDLDGFEVCRRLKANSLTRHIPVLMVTGLEDTDSVHQAFEAGAAGFITKPVNYPVLIHHIRFQLRAARESHELRESRERLAMAQHLARLGHWRWDSAADRFELSEELARLCELDLRHWQPTLERFVELIDPEDREQFRLALRNALEKGRLGALDYRILTTSGKRLHIHQELALSLPGVLLGTVQDVTRQYESEQRIRQLAYSDELTGLASRSYFQRHLEDTINLAARHDETFSLLYLDLDSFKDINDTLGHDVGDELLKEVARRLQKILRKTDFAARLGGDEFCILVDNVSINYAAEVATRCLEEVNRPIQLGAQTFNPRISIGIANFPGDGTDAQTLLKAADSAMYAAKQEGKHRYAFYQPELTIRAQKRLDMERELRRALEQEDLELHYQPQISLLSGRIVGVEALVRWKHPLRGLVPPDEFIHVAERIGLIQHLGAWVLNTACRQTAHWIAQGHDDLQVAVNISPLHFKDPAIVEQVHHALENSGLAPDHLELEVTENVVQTDPDNMESFRRLKELGVRIAIDDFGTGYSSLSSLKKLPIDCLKVDQLFVRDMLEEPRSATLVGTIIGLAKALGLNVVAEGVEREEEIQILMGLGCDTVQGYYFSRPVTAQDMPDLLSKIYLPVALPPHPPGRNKGKGAQG